MAARVRSVGVRPQNHKGIPALAGYPGLTVRKSTGKTTIVMRRGFPEASLACREAPETMQAVWVFSSGETVFSSGETEERGMWVLTLGETLDARKVGVYPGRDWTSAEDGCSLDEGI